MQILLALAVLPSFVLLAIVYKQDRINKEPFSLLLKLFVIGATLVVIPAVIVETIGDKILSSIFYHDSIFYLILNNFFVIAVAEEGFKFLFLFLFTRKHKAFDSLYDGLIYSVCVSLGFATLENILYVLQNGLGVALVRAIVSVPGHFFFAIFMGYFYSYYHFNKLASETENHYIQVGAIMKKLPEFSYQPYIVLALIVPMALHGFFDFCLSTENVFFIIVYFLFIIALYIVSFIRLSRSSKQDVSDSVYVYSLLYKKYPELVSYVDEQQKKKAEMERQMLLEQQKQYAAMTSMTQQYSPYQPQYTQQQVPQYQQPQYVHPQAPQYQQPQYPQQTNQGAPYSQQPQAVNPQSTPYNPYQPQYNPYQNK